MKTINKDILFDVDLSITKHEKNYRTYRDVHVGFINAIIKKGKEIKANKIITNGNLGSIIQDSSTIITRSIPRPAILETYLIGTLNGINVFVDPYLLWSDNCIHFERCFDKKFIRKIKIKKIENSLTEEEKDIKIGRIYSGYIIDTKGILI